MLFSVEEKKHCCNFTEKSIRRKCEEREVVVRFYPEAWIVFFNENLFHLFIANEGMINLTSYLSQNSSID